MLRKIAAGTSAAVVAAALAVAPAAAAGLPRPPADPCAEAADCVAVAPAVAEFSTVKRGSGAPPVGTPTPEEPTSTPPDDSGPAGPGPGGAPPSIPPPPLESAGPPPVPEIRPAPAPPIEPAPTPTTAPAEPRRPSEAVLPTSEVPTRLPQTAAESRLLTVAGGVSLIAAGLAWIGGARRRRSSEA